MKKAVFTLNVDDYSPEVCALTYPLLRDYASRIGADFVIISERKYPSFPVVYEKLQIHELGEEYDWSIFFDSDALVHPDLFDVTEVIHKDTVMQNSQDMAANRFAYDDYFRRDGRHIGACNWFTVASNWCLDLWRPLDNLTLDQAVARIHTVMQEKKAGIEEAHLIDDFVLSRNIARFGLKHKKFQDLLVELGRAGDEYLWHIYTLTLPEKIEGLKATLARWGV
jgi:hypothetical protein